jgi:hypothetical protein
MDSTFVAMFPYVITNYGGSLVYGHRYIFQSMPRMLTLWLDFGADVARQQNSKERTDEKTKNVRSYHHDDTPPCRTHAVYERCVSPAYRPSSAWRR